MLSGAVNLVGWFGTKCTRVKNNKKKQKNKQNANGSLNIDCH